MSGDNSANCRHAVKCVVPILIAALTAAVPFSRSVAQVTGLSERPENLSCRAVEYSQSGGIVDFEKVSESISGLKIVDLRFFPELPDAAVMLSNGGIVYRYERTADENGDRLFRQSGVMLDISDSVTRSFDGTSSAEMGLLGFAFDPDFESNGFAYVYYSAVGSTEGRKYEARLSRIQSSDGGVTFDPASEQVMLNLDHSVKNNHWGGSLQFDADGYLYITLGDASTPQNAQDLTVLHGSVLRLDVSGDFPYEIPPDNPFVGDDNVRPEIYAYGFRNPWRASFDRQTGEYWLGDVGHVSWEEVNQVEKGLNYGWPIVEGPDCYDSDDCSVDSFEPAKALLSHESETSAVIGGFVYRGTELSFLTGTYVFGDVTSGNIWGYTEPASGEAGKVLLGNAGSGVFSFAEDSDGELYVVGRHAIRKIVQPAEAPATALPAKLSETGCFDTDNLTAAVSGVIPYSVNSPLWSDGAEKQRWFALPDWYEQDTQIDLTETGDWVNEKPAPY